MAILFAVNACQAPGDVSESAAPKDTATAAGAADEAAAAAATHTESRPPAVALRPAPPIDDDPSHFIGLGPDGLEGRLGRPDLLRREPPAEVWQYRHAACILDLFLYDEDGGKKVVYLEARDLQALEVESRDCLRKLLTARRDAATS
jgi:hypothetical protein